MSNARVTLADLCRISADVFEVSREQVESNSRKRPAVRARFAVYHLADLHTRLSYSEIGRRLRRDHSTVVYGAAQCNWLMLRDPEYRGKVNEVERRVLTGELPTAGLPATPMTERKILARNDFRPGVQPADSSHAWQSAMASPNAMFVAALRAAKAA